MPTPPAIGRLVHYKLTEGDAEQVNRCRADFMAFLRNRPVPSEETGYIGHVGNHVRPGEVYPAMVVRTWEGVNYPGVNLQVHLDGNDTYWAGSRVEGDKPGQWRWPAYQPGQDLKTTAEVTEKGASDAAD